MPFRQRLHLADASSIPGSLVPQERLFKCLYRTAGDPFRALLFFGFDSAPGVRAQGEG